MRGYPQFPFWISITLVKICFSRIFGKPRKNSFELVGTVLKLLERCIQPMICECLGSEPEIVGLFLPVLTKRFIKSRGFCDENAHFREWKSLLLTTDLILQEFNGFFNHS